MVLSRSSSAHQTDLRRERKGSPVTKTSINTRIWRVCVCIINVVQVKGCRCEDRRHLQYHSRLHPKDFIFHISLHPNLCAGLELESRFEREREGLYGTCKASQYLERCQSKNQTKIDSWQRRISAPQGTFHPFHFSLTATFYWNGCKIWINHHICSILTKSGIATQSYAFDVTLYSIAFSSRWHAVNFVLGTENRAAIWQFDLNTSWLSAMRQSVSVIHVLITGPWCDLMANRAKYWSSPADIRLS